MSAAPTHLLPSFSYARSPLSRLPVELIYETQLSALSEHFPYVCKYLFEVFRRSPPSFRAQYILGRLNRVTTINHNHNAFTTALLYPICTQETVEALLRLPEFLAYGKSESGQPDVRLPTPNLPRRLFENLRPRVRRGMAIPWSEEDRPLPFLRYLFDLYHSRHVVAGPPKHDPRILARAVALGFAPLVKFLLGNRADPTAHSAVAVLVAIQKKDLPMVRLLVEGDLGDSRGAKRRRVPDRVACTKLMLQRAVKVGAQDIVQYLLAKGVVPDIQTLRLLQFNG